MNKMLKYLATALFGALVAVGCTPSGTSEDFDESLLYSGSGLWSWTFGGNEMHHKFNADGTGWEQDITDDAPQMPFKWALEGDELAFYHWMELEQEYGVPEICTVVSLNATSMTITTESGSRRSYTKQQ